MLGEAAVFLLWGQAEGGVGAKEGCKVPSNPAAVQSYELQRPFQTKCFMIL